MIFSFYINNLLQFLAGYFFYNLTNLLDLELDSHLFQLLTSILYQLFIFSSALEYCTAFYYDYQIFGCIAILTLKLLLCRLMRYLIPQNPLWLRSKLILSLFIITTSNSFVLNQWFAYKRTKNTTWDVRSEVEPSFQKFAFVSLILNVAENSIGRFQILRKVNEVQQDIQTHPIESIYYFIK